MPALQRPERNYETGSVTRLLRIVSVVLIASTSLTLLVRYPWLPHEIPVHFNVSGEADSWGPRGSIFLLIGIFSVIGPMMAWLSNKPQLLNVPFEITEQNAQGAYRESERLIVWMLAAIALLYLAIALAVLLERNMGWLMIIAMVGVAAALAAGITRLLRVSR